MRFLRWAYLVPLGFAASQIAYFSDKLPPIIATHFGASGVADGWGSPRTFLGIYAALLVVITLMFCAIPAFARRVPTKWVNLPNRDYWLAPERKEATIAILERWANGFGLTTLCFLVYVFHLTLQANLRQPAILAMSPFMISLALFLFAAFTWVFVLLGPFLKKNNGRQ